MKARLISLALAALLAGGLLAPASGEPSKRKLHLDILLMDGTRILGRAPDVRLALATAFGHVELKLASGDRIDSNNDQETVTFRSGKGDVIKGAISASRHPRSFRMDNGQRLEGWDWEPRILVCPYGSSKLRDVFLAGIRSLRAMDPIRIAGSEGADWEIAYENASGWEPRNLAGALTVTGIDSDSVHSAGGGKWGSVHLRRPVECSGDFHLVAEISWDDKGAGLRTMQNLFVSLADERGGLIAAVGHIDGWVGETGSRFSQLPGIARTHSSGYNTEPTRGRAKLEIVRTGEKVEILWNGKPKHHGKSTAPASRVEVQFDFYDYQNRGLNSVFGSVTLHSLEVR